MRCPKCGCEMIETTSWYWKCPCCGAVVYATSGDDSDEEEVA